MNNNAIAIDCLTKKYDGFCLDNISFSVPTGAIVGLVGENGAGKSTILNAILGLIKKDSGTISILGKQEHDIDKDTREHLGVVFDSNNFPENFSPKQLNNLFKSIYTSWNEQVYFDFLSKLSLPLYKKAKTFSKGMKMKLSIAIAFSYQTKIMILDEATSGLDPIIRDDILDLLLDYVQDEERSILVSSHITSDLEKIADYIIFVHEGKIVFCKSKDELIYNYGVIKCGAVQFHSIDKQEIVAYRKQDYEWQVLISDKAKAYKKYPKATITPATIDEIMLLYIKGERP